MTNHRFRDHVITEKTMSGLVPEEQDYVLC